MLKLASKLVLKPKLASFATMNKAKVLPVKLATKMAKTGKSSWKKKGNSPRVMDVSQRRHNLFLKLIANPSVIDTTTADAYFQLFTASSHSNQNISKIVSASPELFLAYIEYFYGRKMMAFDPKPSLRILEIVFDLITVHPAEKVAKGIEMIFNYLDHHKCICIQPSMISRFYTRLIMIAKDMDSAVEMLDALKTSEPVLVAQNAEMRQYYTKWAYLSTLDQLEGVLTKPVSTPMVTNATLKKINKNGGDVLHDEYTATFTGRTNAWTGNTFVRVKNGFQEFNATLTHYNESEDYSFVVPSTTAVDCSIPWTIYNVDFLGTFKAQLDALALFSKQGKSNPVYDYLMGNKTPPEFEVGESTTRIKNYWGKTASLNDSQIEAIDGVMKSPLSLIQGPPGTRVLT